MKVLFITRNFPPAIGGMEKLSYNLINNFPGEKKVIALKKNNNKLNLIWFIPYSLIKAFFYINDVDLIHISDPVLSLVGFIIKKISKKPIIINLHGLDLSYNNSIYQKYISFFLPYFDKCICISRAVEIIARKKGINKTVVIPIGIDIQNRRKKINKAEARKNLYQKFNLKLDNKFVLLTVGRLIRRKGVIWFLKNVIPKISGQFLYLIVGSGSEKEEIIQLINRRYNDKVSLFSNISDDDLYLFYKSSDVFIMPNIPVKRDVEGFGIVALEAAASGLPVVASRIDGIEESVNHGENGILIKPKDSQSYVKILKELHRNNKKRVKMGVMAKKYTINKFSWGGICNLYLNEFKKILHE